MSYGTIGQCAADSAFVSRISACLSQEQLVRGDAVDSSQLGQIVWAVASASDVAAAYASAVTAQHKNPGGDDAVVTDGMILSNVQAHYPTPPA